MKTLKFTATAAMGKSYDTEHAKFCLSKLQLIAKFFERFFIDFANKYALFVTMLRNFQLIFDEVSKTNDQLRTL